uniref:Uncharacterized protein n=2 Tax=viral metagenome TaxID=1070528 RepID=A0A6H1ZYQ7_9ZZZZ
MLYLNFFGDDMINEPIKSLIPLFKAVNEDIKIAKEALNNLEAKYVRLVLETMKIGIKDE